MKVAVAITLLRYDCRSASQRLEHQLSRNLLFNFFFRPSYPVWTRITQCENCNEGLRNKGIYAMAARTPIEETKTVTNLQEKDNKGAEIPSNIVRDGLGSLNRTASAPKLFGLSYCFSGVTAESPQLLLETEKSNDAVVHKDLLMYVVVVWWRITVTWLRVSWI